MSDRSMTLLGQFQAEAVDQNTELPSLLRRCRVLAQRLGLPEFKRWVAKELDGYTIDDEPPDYRVVATSHHMGTFADNWGRRIAT